MEINCKEFTPVETDSGKKKCFYYVRGGYCTIVNKPYCSVKPPDPLPKINVISHSTISTFKNCKRKIWYNKIKRFRPIVRKDYFVMGSVLHELMAEIYQNKLDQTWDYVLKKFQDEKAEEPKVKTVDAIALLTAYINYMGSNSILVFPDLISEKKVVVDFYGYTLMAIYDGIAKDESYFVEYKFVGGKRNLVNIGKLEHEGQLSLYFMINPKLQRCVLNLIKKPGFQFNPVKEDLKTYMNRTRKDIVDHPGKYFRPVVYERDNFDIKSFEKEFKASVDDLVSLPIEMEAFYKNEQACNFMECEYQSICETGVVDPEKYYVSVIPKEKGGDEEEKSEEVSENE